MRAWLIIRGLAGLALGALIAFMPVLSIETFALMIGIFFVMVGVIRIVIGAVDSRYSAGLRVLNVITGVVLVILGAISIRNPGVGLLATVLMIGFAWIMEGAVTLAMLPPQNRGRGWAIASGVISLLAGAAIVAWPIGAILPLLIIAGAALAVGGIFDLVNAFSLKRLR
jgi:uncharacterized membrane protein HdeD (DUF308 family)